MLARAPCHEVVERVNQLKILNHFITNLANGKSRIVLSD